MIRAHTKLIAVAAVGAVALAAGGVAYANTRATSPTVDTFDLYTVDNFSTPSSAGGIQATQVWAYCTEGDYAVGGGYRWNGAPDPSKYSVTVSEFSWGGTGNPQGWYVEGLSNDVNADDYWLMATVVCMHKSS